METITSEKHGHGQWHPEVVNDANGSSEKHNYIGNVQRKKHTNEAGLLGEI